MSGRRRLSAIVAGLGAAVLLVIAVITIAGRGGASHPPRTLQIEMQAAGTAARLFWATEPQFVEDRSIRVPLQPLSAGFQRLRFPLPPQGARWIRFDPTDAPGEILIGTVQLLDSNGQVLAAFDPERFKPASQIASTSRQGDVMRVVTEPLAHNPSLVATLACVGGAGPLDGFSRVTPGALAVVSVAAIVLLLACLVILGRRVFEREPQVELVPTNTGPRTWTRGLTAVWLVALFLVVFSAKLLLMRDNPVTAPFWDQWDAEAMALYVPYDNCDLRWSQMFALHNEHRVFFTRLLALDLLVLNGQWDPRLEQVANAAMHTLTAVFLVAIFWVTNQRRRLDLLAFVGALMFAAPFAWDNTLSGFQSAFYCLLLFSVPALWLTTHYRAGSAPWFLGWICAAAALFTSAGGVVTSVAVVAVVAMKLANDRREWLDALVTLTAAAAVIGIGVAAASAPIPGHAPLRAQTAREFSYALGHNLAWPWTDRPQLAVVMWLPVGLLLVTVALRRARTTELTRLILGFSIWVVLSAGAVAYGRGAGGAQPATRYMDFLSLGVVANAVALVSMLDRDGTGRVVRRLAGGALAAWLVFAFVGVDRLTRHTQADLSTWRQFYAAHAANVRRFVVTGELAEFTAKRPLYDLPYPDAASLAGILRDPFIRRILPAAVREPLHLEPRAVTNDAFVPDGSPVNVHDPLRRGWGSYSDRGRSAEGRFDSGPVAPCRPGQRLRFPVSGYLGLPHQYFALKDVGSGRDLAAIMPPAIPREGWIDAIVACPDRLFAITAIDAAGDSWFAFREPVEVGWASLASERLIRWSRELFLAALAMAGLAMRWTVRS
jgi:hypothetical protein